VHLKKVSQIPIARSRSPGRAVREGDVGTDVGDVDNSASSCVFSGVHDELEGNFDLLGDVLTANFVFTKAECAALLRRGRALTPANWADASSAILTRRVAQGAAQFLAIMADKRGTCGAAVRVLCARDANIRHSNRAVWRADATAHIMEARVAVRVPKRAPLLAVTALVHLTGTSAISIGFVTVGAVIAEALVKRAVLPADRANT